MRVTEAESPFKLMAIAFLLSFLRYCLEFTWPFSRSKWGAILSAFIALLRVNDSENTVNFKVTVSWTEFWLSGSYIYFNYLATCAMFEKVRYTEK